MCRYINVEISKAIRVYISTEHPDRWTSDSVQLRLKTRTHVQPINGGLQGAAGFVPSWKQELLEKRRKRESLSLPADKVSVRRDGCMWRHLLIKHAALCACSINLQEH